MFALDSIAARQPMPYGFIWEIDFAAILAVSLVLAIKYPFFGKRWALILFAVGVAEFEFSIQPPTPPPFQYSALVVGVLIGLATAYSGIIIPVSYWAKQHFRKKQVKIFFILSGCLELIVVSLSILYRISVEGPIMALLGFGLLIIGFYSLIVGIAAFFFGKPKKATVNESIAQVI
jgi:hypothetical protein